MIVSAYLDIDLLLIRLHVHADFTHWERTSGNSQVRESQDHRSRCHGSEVPKLPYIRTYWISGIRETKYFRAERGATDFVIEENPKSNSVGTEWPLRTAAILKCVKQVAMPSVTSVAHFWSHFLHSNRGEYFLGHFCGDPLCITSSQNAEVSTIILIWCVAVYNFRLCDVLLITNQIRTKLNVSYDEQHMSNWLEFDSGFNPIE